MELGVCEAMHLLMTSQGLHTRMGECVGYEGALMGGIFAPETAKETQSLYKHFTGCSHLTWPVATASRWTHKPRSGHWSCKFNGC